MIKIAITQAAFEAIAASMLLGSVAYENEVTAMGKWLILVGSALDRQAQGAARQGREL
jgi:hypothetical protein